MGKLNCWEMMKCGREPSGAKAMELGVCPACTESSADKLNGGKNGGRLCWAIVGTLCGGKVQGSMAQKELTCLTCDFFRAVQKEEGQAFKLLKPGQSIQHRH